MKTVVMTDKEFFLVKELVHSAAEASRGCPGPRAKLEVSYVATTPDMVDLVALDRRLAEIAARREK